jgi:hypothetical protein
MRRQEAAPAASLAALWASSNERVLRAYFDVQNATAGILPRADISEEIVVDEGHPFFFDHPLDHVPGILLIDGILALLEQLRGPRHVSLLDVRFRAFCEKNGRIDVVASPTSGRGRVMQHGREICSFAFSFDDRPPALNTAVTASNWSPADPVLVHKLRPENVLVSALVRDAQGFSCTASAPPPGHHLHDRPERSPLYAIEVARQELMLVAHGEVGIPLGMPMNLLGVRVKLDRALPSGAPIRISTTGDTPRRLGSMTLGEVRIDLRGLDGQALGEVTIKAQVVDPSTYQQQRRAVP